MSVRSEMFSRFSNSFGNVVDSGFDLAKTTVTQMGKENQRQEQKEQLFKSNQYTLTTAYRKGLGDVMQGLPESTDFESYGERIKEYNNQFTSEMRASGNYDDESLSWLENTFIPSQKTTIEKAVDGISNYAINTWLSSRASGYANVLAADPDMDVETATKLYAQYYDRVRLGDIENGHVTYGILTPDEFREAIRENKTLQSFERLCVEGYGYDPSWNMEKAIQKSLQESGYKPNAVQMTNLRQQAQATVNARIKEIKDAVAQDTDSFSVAINNAILTGMYYDTKDLDGAIASYPVAYAGSLMQAKVTAQKANDLLIYNSVAQGTLPLDDDTLSCMSPDSDYRAKLISNDVSARAKSMFNTGTQIRDVMAWIKNGNLGYTATAEERNAIADSVLKWAKDQVSDEKDLDEIDTFYLQNPQLKGDAATISYADSAVFPQEEEENAPASANDSGAGRGGFSRDERDYGPANVAEDIPSAPGKTAVQEPASPTVVYGIAPQVSGAVSMGTTTAQNAALQTSVQQDSLPSIDKPYVYENLFYAKYVQCLPNDVIKSKVEQAYKNGWLTKETAEDLAKDFVFGDNPNWTNMLGTVDSTIEMLMPEASYQEKKNAKTRIYMSLVQSVGNDMDLLNDGSTLNAAMNMVANDIAASSWLGKTQSYSKASDKADGYIKALSKASYADVRQAISDGSMTPFINVAAQNEYLKGNPESNGSVKDMRDFFTRQLGYGKSYDDLGNDLERLMVEYNVTYAQFRGDMRSLFVETFKDYVNTGNSEILWFETGTDLGGSFAFRDSEDPSLYFFPDFNTIEKVDGRLAATWFFAYDTDGDSVPDSDPMKFTSLARIVSDMSGFRAEEERKAEKNAEMLEGVSKLSETAEKAEQGFNEVAADKGRSFLVRATAAQEATRSANLLMQTNFLGTFFGMNKGKYTREEELVKDTLEAIRNM